MNSTLSIRPLSSLADSPQDCQTLLALAFGYAPPLDGIKTFSVAGPLTVRSLNNELILYPDGQILASRFDQENSSLSLCFNAYKVVTWLKQSNIEFGGNNPVLV